jgi:hypothetical protein
MVSALSGNAGVGAASGGLVGAVIGALTTPDQVSAGPGLARN